LVTSRPVHWVPQLLHVTSQFSDGAMVSPVAFHTQAVSAGMRLPSSPGVYLLPHEAQGWWSGRRGLVGLVRLRMASIQSWVTCSRNATHSLFSTCCQERMIAQSDPRIVPYISYWCCWASLRMSWASATALMLAGMGFSLVVDVPPMRSALLSWVSSESCLTIFPAWLYPMCGWVSSRMLSLRLKAEAP